MPRPAPRSAYVHVPFCRHRCGYCNFTVVAGRDDLFGPLLEAIECEFASGQDAHEVDTLYIGGGTPSHLPIAELSALLQSVRRWRPPATGGEWTCEANPEDVTGDLATVLVDHGVTRVSLGVQSFDNEKLQRLDRSHSGDDARQAIERLKSVGLQTAVDLIFAAPGETAAHWRSDVQRAVQCQPDHISTYGLTFEHGTTFWNKRAHGQLSEVDEELQRAMYLEGIDLLEQAGYRHYEVSNFALPGRRSRHNEVYWAGQEYFAEGPGAARYISGVRETNHRSTTTYIKRVLAGESPVAQREQLDNRRRAGETLVLALRTIEGVRRDRFREQTGYSIDQLAGDAVSRYVAMGLLADDGQCVRLTREGLLVSDALWPDLL